MINKIFCIDDDPITLMLYKMVISKASFAETIITANNGQQALDYYDNLSDDEAFPELVFLDLNMPIMGGWEFLNNFAQEKYSRFNQITKIIVLSSTIDPNDIETVKKYPIIIDFISKPITKAMLEQLKNTI